MIIIVAAVMPPGEGITWEYRWKRSPMAADLSESLGPCIPPIAHLIKTANRQCVCPKCTAASNWAWRQLELRRGE